MMVITYFSGNHNETVKENDRDKIDIIKLAVEEFVGLFFNIHFFLKFCSKVSDNKNEVANRDDNSLSGQ